MASASVQSSSTRFSGAAFFTSFFPPRGGRHAGMGAPGGISGQQKTREAKSDAGFSFYNGLSSCWMPNWCGWSDSNRHDLRHHPLKMACLPISPHPRIGYFFSPGAPAAGCSAAGGGSVADSCVAGACPEGGAGGAIGGRSGDTAPWAGIASIKSCFSSCLLPR